MTPFRMIGNLYFVGTLEASSHLIDTGDGLILIDTGYVENAPLIIESLAELGFDIKDVKIILHSHGHGDHTLATAELLKHAPLAKTYVKKEDEIFLRGRFEPDYDMSDGDVIRLGNTEILILETPGHTRGTVSFFFDVTENGVTYRAGMFGGAGTNQLKKRYLDSATKWRFPYRLRGMFFDSVERLRREKVDVFVGNHARQNKTPEKYELMKTASANPFVDPTEWGIFLDAVEARLMGIIKDESRTEFVNYAHRGASTYCPENTMLSFYTGVYMGANGIETDVQKTKDGVLVLYHDDTLGRILGIEGSIKDYTYEELLAYDVKNGELRDKIPTLDDFLSHFKNFDLTFAIELKVAGIEREVADMIRKHGCEGKVIITSFIFGAIEAMKECAPELRVGFLTRLYPKDVEGDEKEKRVIADLIRIGADEICPAAGDFTPERVERWHRLGFRVRSWDISNRDVMKAVCDAGADGMTVNFPDKLTEYIKEQV